jgi:hypothetical protein
VHLSAKGSHAWKGTRKGASVALCRCGQREEWGGPARGGQKWEGGQSRPQDATYMQLEADSDTCVA